MKKVHVLFLMLFSILTLSLSSTSQAASNCANYGAGMKWITSLDGYTTSEPHLAVVGDLAYCSLGTGGSYRVTHLNGFLYTLDGADNTQRKLAAYDLAIPTAPVETTPPTHKPQISGLAKQSGVYGVRKTSSRVAQLCILSSFGTGDCVYLSGTDPDLGIFVQRTQNEGKLSCLMKELSKSGVRPTSRNYSPIQKR